MDKSLRSVIIFTLMSTCSFQDLPRSGPMSQTGNNFFSQLFDNTAGQMNGMAVKYNPADSMPPMTSYGQNCPPLTGMSGSNAVPHSMNFGVNQLSNSMKTMQSYMPGMASGCGCMMTVSKSGCLYCPCQVASVPTHATHTVNRPVQTSTELRLTHRDKNRHRISTSVVSLVSLKTTTPLPASKSSYNSNKTRNDHVHHNSDITMIENRSTNFQHMIEQTTQKSVYTSGSGFPEPNSTTGLPIENENTTPFKKEKSIERSENLLKEKSFPIAIAAGSALLLLMIVCLVFVIMWCKLRKKFKRERNELYFVEKSFRQSVSSDDDSMKSRDEIIYSLIGKRRPPDLPLRTSTVIPTAPPASPTAPPISPISPPILPITPSAGQTCFINTPNDPKHDYLELI